MTSSPVTAEYVLNLIHFMPAQTSINFILSPQRYRFPVQLLAEYAASAAGGGKHVILVGARERMSYEALVEGFVETVRSMQRQSELDINRDKVVTVGEWLQRFDARARENKLTLLPYWLESSPELLSVFGF